MEMANCNHEFIGREDGVYCKKCGIHMTVKEYQESLTTKKPPKKRKEIDNV